MPEDFEQESQESIDWGQYLGIARRRIWYFLVPFFSIWLIVWSASWVIKPTYRSSTLILVQQPSVPTSIIPSNISDDIQNRLMTITQQILSRTSLLQIINQLNLYPDVRAHSNPDELVDRMRKDILLDLDRGSSPGQIAAFRVSYSSRNPYMAQQVTSELANLFINENLKDRQRKVDNITNFLADQLEQARQSLAAQEQKVREFNQQHLGELPDQEQGNLAILHGLQSQLEGEQNALNAAKERNAYLQSLIEQYRALARTGKSANGSTVVSGLPAIDQELDRLRNQLADLSSRYTDEYPDVRKVKDQIAKTEKMKEQMEAQLKSAPPADTQASDPATARDAGPTLELQSQLKANQIEISNREQAIKILQGRIDQYQVQLHDAPIRQQQLTELNRGYDQSKADYDTLLKKKNEAELSKNVEYEEQGEHFSIQDPPNLPIKPDSPNRLKFFAGGIVLGLLLGAGCALGVEFLDNRIFSEAEFKKLVPAEVMVEIPSIPTPKEEHREKQNLRAVLIASGAVAFSMFVALAVTVLHG